MRDDLNNMDITAIARQTRDALAAEHGEREAGAMSWIILEHLTGERRGRLMVRGDLRLNGTQQNSLKQIVEEIRAGKPLQYVLGETEFYGLHLKVNPSVLIPRPETEELVDLIIRDRFQPGYGQEQETTGRPVTILDIGTGSGCIAIALARHLPASMVWACDISDNALSLARENAQLNHVAVRFEQVDILSAEARKVLPECDVLVSNPPYVTRAEMEAMAPHVLEYEPHLALFVENNDSLLFYREIVAFAMQRLHPKGQLYLEINEALGEETCELLQKTGLHHVELRKDLHGKDRMIKAVR